MEEEFARAADALAVAPLLNCLLREAAAPAADPEGPGPAHRPGHDGRSGHGGQGRGSRAVYRLRAGGRLLRVRGGPRPADPELWTDGVWQPLGHAGLVALAVAEMHASTGRPDPGVAAEMAASRTAVAAALAIRARTAPPADLWLRSEQALVMGHPFHPAPKACSGGPPARWMRYAPEAYGTFPLVLLGVREDAAVDAGDTRDLDGLGQAPPGYRLLPAHPWQYELSRGLPEVRRAFADGRLVRLGRTPWRAAATASVRTVHVPAGRGGPGPAEDLFLKFSLDVRITSAVRRMSGFELVHMRRVDPFVTAAFRAMGGPAAWLREPGHRTVAGLEETFPVLIREGLGRHLAPGTTAVLAGALAEGFEGSPLDRVAAPLAWWRAYLRCLVPPVLDAYARYGVSVECHLQNTLVAVGADGMPVHGVFRDGEGARVVPQVTREAAWQRLVYCLVVNNLSEIAGALAERFPASAGALWPAARAEFERCARAHAGPAGGRPDGFPELTALLAAPTVPGKANLLSRWFDPTGLAPRYLPYPNPLAV
ncbi:IucA/IucC family siderophore biosynthesis protein [Streptomyces bambusae]|uniref:IucA/IucC family protein n=1 Tax=Streptomyces bambusae TaxID=1550616 RepID=UPI001CFFD9E3|nr:IucA/IucC family protein [Streptomyces bambusae]MCB5169490.1 IucA/IucC family siderophore biosynthesis protein [Streptomyces bambusae]